MKALKIILFAAISILLIAVVVGYLQPRKIEITMSEVINAPTCVVFDNVNDLSKRTQWSPWEQMDTTIQSTLGEKTKGLGASYTWTSENSGDGKLTYIDYKENEYLKSELDFGQEQPAYASFTFKEVEDGVEVTWTFEGDMGGAFYSRLFGVMMKAILEQTYNQGLINLAAQVKEDTENPCVAPAGPKSMTDGATILKNGEGIGVKGEIVEMEIAGANYISVVDSCEVTSDQIAQLIGTSYGKLVGYAQQAGQAMTSAPFVLYQKWDPPTKVVMEPSLLVDATELETPEGINFSSLASTKVIMGTHMGDYGDSEYLWNALDQYAKDNGLEIIGSPWHEYITDPSTELDTNKWESRIYYPVQ